MARLPELTERDQLPEGDRDVYDYVIKSRGRMGLPYSVFMNHPQLAKLKLEVGHFVRFDTSLPHNISELTICTAAREMDCKYEWAAHAPAAGRQGVSEAAVDVIAHRKPVDTLSDEEALPIDFTRQLLLKHRVDDATYAKAQALYGDRGVIEMTMTAGYYIMSACWMNIMQIEPPADRAQLPDAP